MPQAVAYYRVSTKRQGTSRLGIEAQEEAVSLYSKLTETEVVKKFFEVESGKKNNRLILKKAVRYCRKHGFVLIIAKIDRLARNAFLVADLIQSGIKIVAADKPLADELELLEDAIKAQRVGDTISKNTRDALQAAKRRGVILGKHAAILVQNIRQQSRDHTLSMIPEIEKLRKEGYTTEGNILAQLKKRRIPPMRGPGYRWHPSTVHYLLKRIEKIQSPEKATKSYPAIPSPLN
jgi:DNA invertase Pin-like site-specific DNA recombinase